MKGSCSGRFCPLAQTTTQGAPLSVARFVEVLSGNVVSALELPCWECEQLRVGHDVV